MSDIDLTMTRMGVDDIRRLFEKTAGMPLSQPEFELNGASLSMRMRSVAKYGCTSGMFSCAASQVQVYRQDAIDCGADSHDEDGAAEERARKLLDREEIVRQAEEKAKTIVSEANQQATQLRTTVTKYCDNMLATTQEQLQKSFNEMKIVRDNLKK